MRDSAMRLFSALLLSSMLLSGCGGSDVKQTTTTTMGQELIDLKESHDRGIITDEEYQRAKKDIIERYR